MDFNLLRRDNQEDDRSSHSEEGADKLTLSALSTIRKRKATESRSVKLENKSGLDFLVSPSGSRGLVMEQKLVSDGSHVFLESYFGADEFHKLSDLGSQSMPTLSLTLAQSSAAVVGERQPILNLAAGATSDVSISLHRLHPTDSYDHHRVPCSSPVIHRGKSASGRGSPDTNVSGASSTNVSGFMYYNAEPVVEWCMQNQRLRSSIVDVYSLEQGRDLLSCCIWSPEDEKNIEPEAWRNKWHTSPPHSYDGREADASNKTTSPTRRSRLTPTSNHAQRENWVRPYLKNDSPEWTDMTCILRMARERVMLPDSNWIWLDDWTVDLSGSYGEETDADGWEYEADFETFNRTRRFYKRGDACRRRRWTRTRIVRPPKLDDPHRQLSIVWETQRDENGDLTITVKSHLVLHNSTASTLAFFAYSPSWEDDKFLGEVEAGGKLNVPVSLASATTLRLAKRRRPLGDPATIKDFAVSQRVMILPTSYTSSVLVRTSIRMSDFPVEASPVDAANGELHYLVHVKCEKGVVDILVEPVLKVINLLPCQLQCELGEVLNRSNSNGVVYSRPVSGGKKGKKIVSRETLTIPTGDEGKCTALNPASKPHISLRVPGYQWSPWQRIVNRKAESFTWYPSGVEEELHARVGKGDVDYVEEFKSVVRFERIRKAGDPLVLIVSVEVGHCPTIRVYAQYWILDKTGFGCRFCDGFADLLGAIPDRETSRRSHLLPEEAKDQKMQKDICIPGHQWSIGMSGMSLFFSDKEKFAMSIESGVVDEQFIKGKNQLRSKWVSPMDVSIVMPKTVFSVDEYGGPRRFELAMSVTVCPAIFARTKLITLYPRYQIVNLLGRELVVAQDGCLKSSTVIPSQSSVPFHRERQSLPPKARLAAPSAAEIANGSYEGCWTNGCIQLDKVGITSMRFPDETSLSTQPMVVQAEVRLATKDQSSAVVIVIWSTNENSNPLYLLRNLTSRTIICRQPLQDDGDDSKFQSDSLISVESCSGGHASMSKYNAGFECGSEIGPIIRGFLGLDRMEEFVWILRKRQVSCFGFDDPEKPHILEWACVSKDDPNFDGGSKKAFVEVDAMGSSSALIFSDGTEIKCHIIAEHSTKVIEFFEPNKGSSGSSTSRGVSFGLEGMQQRGQHFESLIESSGDRIRAKTVQGAETEEDEEVAFSLRLDIPAISISFIDNATPMVPGREILLALFDRFIFEFSQNREGYHEFELTLMTLQVDNFVPQSIHPVLVSRPILYLYAYW